LDQQQSIALIKITFFDAILWFFVTAAAALLCLCNNFFFGCNNVIVLWTWVLHNLHLWLDVSVVKSERKFIEFFLFCRIYFWCYMPFTFWGSYGMSHALHTMHLSDVKSVIYMLTQFLACKNSLVRQMTKGHSWHIVMQAACMSLQFWWVFGDQKESAG